MTQASKRWAVWKWFYITRRDGSDLYLRRLRLIQTPLFAIYIHWIYRADADRQCHDHPWAFTSFVLKGGYEEEQYHRTGETTFRPVRFLNLAPYGKIHRINRLFSTPTITLMFVGRRRDTWGFYNKTSEGYEWIEWPHFEGAV